MHNNKIRKDGYSVPSMCCNGGRDLFMLMGEIGTNYGRHPSQGLGPASGHDHTLEVTVW